MWPNGWFLGDTMKRCFLYCINCWSFYKTHIPRKCSGEKMIFFAEEFRPSYYFDVLACKICAFLKLYWHASWADHISTILGGWKGWLFSIMISFFYTFCRGHFVMSLLGDPNCGKVKKTKKYERHLGQNLNKAVSL